MAQDQDKAELIAELAAQRIRLTTNLAGLRRDLDFPTRARRAFRSSPLPWMGGATIIGIIIARLTGQRKKVIKVLPKKDGEPVEKAAKAGLVLGVLKIGFDFARPLLLGWLKQRFSTYFGTAAPPAARVR